MRTLLFCALAGAALTRPLPASAPGGVREGEMRTYYASGRLHEIKHYHAGREDGLQQAWTEDGVRYLNYEMRGGRRYGFVNARPCATVTPGGLR